MTDAEKKARELVTLANTVSVKRWEAAIASAIAAERERALDGAIKVCEARRDKHEMDSARQAEGGYEIASDHSFDLQMEAERCAQAIRALKGGKS